MSSITKRSLRSKTLEQFRVPPQTTDVAIEQFLTALNCPRSLTVWLLYSSQSSCDHDQLTSLECVPDRYPDMQTFRDAYAATKFLSKANFLETTFDKKKVAMEKFFRFEEQCRQTNSRFRNLQFDPLFNGPNVWLLNATVQKISRILGNYRPDELFDQANWGPGVTTLLKGERVSAINKFHLENGITEDLYSLVGGEIFRAAYPVWSEHLSHFRGEKCFEKMVGNTIVTVPKDSKADRVIAVEPGINLWFQKACGNMIRSRLRNRVLVDLNTQEWNQKYSYYSSKDGVLATCDFSSASDSISRAVVEELVPLQWFRLLDACRSRYGVMQDKIVKWEKFSSMGNGFTFELETLIFFAAACAVCEYCGVGEEVCVFGDDVLLPSVCMPLFSSYTEFLGFTVNQKKSFSTGYFRESCGAHYYDGVDVKPIFLKEKVRNVPAVYKLANGIRNLAHRRNASFGCDRVLRYPWQNLWRVLPKVLRLTVTRSLGDVGFVGNFDEACPPRARHQLEGYKVDVLTAVGVTDYFDGQAVLMARLWSPSSQEYGNSYTLRGRVKHRFKQVLVSQWYNFGPWL